MQSKIIVTGDNSKTLLIPELNETYHSTNGARTEAMHIFINEGLKFLKKKSLSIFEMGFGTGLNALFTLDEAIKQNLEIDYHTIEPSPLDLDLINSINYIEELQLNHLKEAYSDMHKVPANHQIDLLPKFRFKKFISAIQDQELTAENYDLVYFDAFAPKVQPELWELPVLKKMYDSLKHGGILVTYCSQGQFKRNLKSLGFEVTSVHGPPGKREITRATKV